MTPNGSRLGRLLYYFLLTATGLLALMALGVVLAIGAALFAPDLWPDYATVRVNHGPAMALDTTTVRVAGMLTILGALALGAMVLLPLVGLMRSTAAGAPFVTANVRRLHIISGAFALYAVICLIVPLFITPGIAQLMHLDGPSFNLGQIMMMLIILVLAEVFRQGVALREDAEGTI